MPRRPTQVNEADLRRVIRACQKENVTFRVTLQPNGNAVFEPAALQPKMEAEQIRDLAEDL